MSSHKRNAKTSGALVRASASTLELLDRLGLSWVLDALTTGIAAGVLIGEYGSAMLRSQLDFYHDARLAVRSVGRDNNIAGDILDRLLSAIALRIAQLNRLLGLPTRGDFDDIADRLVAIDQRLARVGKRKQSRKRAQVGKAKQDKQVGKEAVRPPKAAAAAPAEPAPAVMPFRESAKAETSPTMFIGSLPDSHGIEAPPERASSLSSEPDAMSAYLAKHPGDPDASGFRSRSRSARRDRES